MPYANLKQQIEKTKYIAAQSEVGVAVATESEPVYPTSEVREIVSSDSSLDVDRVSENKYDVKLQAALAAFNPAGLGTMSTKNVAAAVTNLGTTISASPTQSEVQAIVNKLDELLNALRTAQHITP